MTAPRFGAASTVGVREISKGRRILARYVGNIAGEATRRAGDEAAITFTRAADEAAERASQTIGRAAVKGGIALGAGIGAGTAAGITAGAVGRNAVDRWSKRKRVRKDAQDRWRNTAAAGAATGLAGAGLYGYARNRSQGIAQADANALSGLKAQRSKSLAAADIARRDYETAFTNRMNAQAKEGMLRERWNASGGSKRMKVPTLPPKVPGQKRTLDSVKAAGSTSRSGKFIYRGDPSYARAYRQGRVVHRAESLRNYGIQEAARRSQLANEKAADDARHAIRNFKGTAPQAAAKYKHLARAGKFGAVAGAGAMIAGLAGVEASRKRPPKQAQPRFAAAASVGRKQEIDHAKAKGAAYRAGLPAGKMSREEIDSWYVKSPGELARS